MASHTTDHGRGFVGPDSSGQTTLQGRWPAEAGPTSTSATGGEAANPAAARFTLLDRAPVAVACGFALTAVLAIALRALS